MEKTTRNGLVLATAVLGLFAVQGCMATGQEGDVSSQEKELVQCQGINECKGTSECATEGANSCEGMNECKGMGFLTVPLSECEEKGGTVLS